MSQAALAHLVHRFGKQIRQNGVLCISSNGDPALVGAFQALGWPDPCPIQDGSVRVLEAATVEAPQRAALSSAVKRRLG